MIKAIPTKYKGYEFKSRIEARWAVFFDALGLKWEYEKEGYVLSDGTWYLPDFWLPEVYMRDQESKGIWIEVKGAKPTKEEQLKCELFSEGIGQTIILLWGNVDPAPAHNQPDSSEDNFYEYSYPHRWDNRMCFLMCHTCDTIKVEYAEQNYRDCPVCHSCADHEHPLLIAATNKARNAKF